MFAPSSRYALLDSPPPPYAEKLFGWIPGARDIEANAKRLSNGSNSSSSDAIFVSVDVVSTAGRPSSVICWRRSAVGCAGCGVCADATAGISSAAARTVLRMRA
jgi:hypothetical protein